LIEEFGKQIGNSHGNRDFNTNYKLYF
jgi:hypothetical protein